jgi:hypothetical protein
MRRLHFPSSEGVIAGETAVSVEVSDSAGLGLFMVPEGGELAELGLDLAAFEEGGLTSRIPSTSRRPP